MKIGITCPIFVSHPDHIKYLNLTTNSFVSADHDIYFLPVENYIAPEFRPLSYALDHQPEEVVIIQGADPQSVSSAWNLGIKMAADMDLEYILVTNTDIVLKSDAIDKLVAFAKDHSEFVMWTMSEWSDLSSIEDAVEDQNFSEHPHFSCFMVRPSNFTSTMGKFDENFVPAWCEDGDMHARIALLNQIAVSYGGAKFYHFGSRSIKSDIREWEKNKVTFPKNQQYFLDKWGHPPVNNVEDMREVYYKMPFNDETKSVNDWSIK